MDKGCCSSSRTEGSQADLKCPTCGTHGRPVDTVTLKSLLRPDALVRLDPQAGHRFCGTSACPVVYWWAADHFVETELRVPVFQKRTADPLLVCYCFGFTEKDVERDARQLGRSSVLDTIRQHVVASRCACELQNPQGTCCLGNVSAVADRAMQSRPGMQH